MNEPTCERTEENERVVFSSLFLFETDELIDVKEVHLME